MQAPVTSVFSLVLNNPEFERTFNVLCAGWSAGRYRARRGLLRLNLIASDCTLTAREGAGIQRRAKVRFVETVQEGPFRKQGFVSVKRIRSRTSSKLLFGDLFCSAQQGTPQQRDRGSLR